MKIDPKSERVCISIDPDGPVVWFGDNHLLGRQNSPHGKDNLIRWGFAHGLFSMTGISTMGMQRIDWISEARTSSESSKALVMVVSNSDKRFNIIDLSRLHIDSDGPYAVQKDTEIVHRLISPDGKKIVSRCFEDGGAPVLKVYDLVPE